MKRFIPERLRNLWPLLLLAMTATPSAGQDFPILAPETETEIRSDDLIRLTTSYSEAVLEYRTASLRYRTLQRLGPNANLTGLEIQLAELSVQTARNKLEVLQAIGEKLLALAESRAAFIRRLEREGDLPPAAGSGPNPRLMQVEADVNILRMILAMNPIQPATVESLPAQP